MRLISTVTAKAQVTIPKALREIMRIKRGDKIIFILKKGEVVLKRLGKEEESWLKLAESSFAEWDNPEDAVYDYL